MAKKSLKEFIIVLLTTNLLIMEGWLTMVENFQKIVKEAYDNKLKNKLFGLLCEFEKGRDWEKFLDSILIELMGYPEEEKSIYYFTLF